MGWPRPPSAPALPTAMADAVIFYGHPANCPGR